MNLEQCAVNAPYKPLWFKSLVCERKKKLNRTVSSSAHGLKIAFLIQVPVRQRIFSATKESHYDDRQNCNRFYIRFILLDKNSKILQSTVSYKVIEFREARRLKVVLLGGES
jgi:hypothetical protein